MTKRTKITAEDGKQEITITREFELPLELLFRAHVEPEIVEQWMGTKVLKLESRKHGSYQFETTDPKGNKHGFNGVIHEYSPNERITRTFEMENTHRCQIRLHVLPGIQRGQRCWLRAAWCSGRRTQSSP